MAADGPQDFMDAYRKMLGHWEKMANDLGAQFLQQKEAAQAVHGLNDARIAMQAQMRDGMLRALDAMQMPTKADIEALGARIGAIEAAAARIETLLASRDQPSASGATAPARTRRPGPARRPGSGQNK